MQSRWYLRASPDLLLQQQLQDPTVIDTLPDHAQQLDVVDRPKTVLGLSCLDVVLTHTSRLTIPSPPGSRVARQSEHHQGT
jgi:hypothetical protein